MARETAGKMHVELLEGPVDSSAAVGEVTSSLVARGADAILVVGDVTVGLAIDAVIAQARKGKIPVISVLPDAVPRGAAVGVGADFYTVGQQMGELCARVLGGADMAKIPVVNTVPILYAFNLKTLEGLKDNWRIPPELVAKADIVVDGTGVHKKAK
jgi:putative ABC transport system substrate-binding protein